MARRLSASVFLITMALLIGLRSPVLGFCHCSERFFVSHCCKSECTLPAEEPNKTCSCCCEEKHQEPKEPCKDCMSFLTINVGEFLWSSLDEPSPDKELILEQPAFAIVDSLSSTTSWTPLTSRPPPPPGLPLYRLHAVVRL